MTDIIRKAAVFIRANAESSRGQRAAAALADMIDGKITADEGLAVLSECLGCELQIKSTVPNEATAFVVFSAREIRSAFGNGNTALACDIADILQALPENRFLSDSRSVKSFNKTYIRKFNKKHITQLPEIV